VILIVVKFQVNPDRREEWLEITSEFTQAVRAEPGNRSFEWFPSAENPNEFVLIEEFESAEAGDVHVKSDHFKTAMERIPDVLTQTPQIVNFDLPGDGWSELVELAKKPSA
jgi:quinol monooxygenase YgiN